MIKKNNTSFICLSALLILTTQTHNAEAGYNSWQETPQPVQVKSYSPGPAPIVQANWFWGIEGGAQRLSGAQSIHLTNEGCCTSAVETNTYSTKNSTGGLIGLDAGRQWQRHTNWFPAYSAAARYRYMMPNNIGHQVTQVSLSNSPSHNYNWKVSSNSLTAQGKLNIMRYNMVLPYVGAGLGVASTQAKSYSETAIRTSTTRVSPAYGDKTNNQFTYNFGAGLDFKFSPQMLWTLGYEHQSLGSVSSGYGADDWCQATLNPGTITNNVLLVSFSYFFEN